MKRRNRLIEQLQYRLRRSYGMDRLNTHLLIMMVVILVLGLFVKNSIPVLLAFVIFIVFMYRFGSRNITKRSIENRKYQDTNRFVTRQLKAIKNNVTNKDYKYFVCKQCYQLVRIPRGKGEVVIHYGNGSRFKGTYKNGKRNGKCIEETKDGKRFEGSYVNDVRDGRFVEKDGNGRVTCTGHYENGKRFNDQ